MPRSNIICVFLLLTVIAFDSVLNQEFKPSDGGTAEVKNDEKSVPKNVVAQENVPVQAEGKSLKPQGKTIMAGSGYIPPQVPFYHAPVQPIPPVPSQYPYPYPYSGYYQQPMMGHRPFYQSNYLENYDVYYSRNNQG